MHKQQRIFAYLWLVYIAGMLCGAHYFFYRYAFHPLNSIEATRGMMAGAVLWTTVLYIAMVRHFGWARYGLAITVALILVGIGWTVMVMNTRSVQSIPGATKAAIAAMALYGLSLVPLGVAGSLRRYLAPLTAGGRWS